MKLATIRVEGRTAAVRIDGDSAVEVPGVADVGDLLRLGGAAEAAPADGPIHPLAGLDFAPLVLRPSKIVCVGLNYREHIAEMHRELPEHPTLFAKFPDSLIGAGDAIVIPPESDSVDWEGELVIVIGRTVRRARGDEAREAIAGFSIACDTSMRDWQYRTTQWLQGKMWADATPVGPWLVTPEEVPTPARITTRIDGVVKQEGEIHDLVHGPVALVEYISTITPLHPGDLILTGTPGGVGHARDPIERVLPGTRIEVEIDGIGVLANTAAAG
jgi:acylpyruvate hydrolase